MVKTELRFKSSDEIHDIMVTIWAPDNKNHIKAIIQVAHGMQEYINRYEKMAEYLTSYGYMVVGNDHLGHGRSVYNKDELGYFAKKNSSDILVKDMYRLTRRIRKVFPNKQIFLLGHSMGSFLTRKYITAYGKAIDGVIICGTGRLPEIVLGTAYLLTDILTRIYGENHRSKFINKLAFGSYNNKIGPNDTGNWLTKNQKIVDAYYKDPYCNFIFTLNGFKTLFSTIIYIQRPMNYGKTPVDLPMYIISGTDDPVGDYGRGVKKVYKIYEKHGMKDLTMKLYNNDRHELFNETDVDHVCRELARWIDKRMKKEEYVEE